MRASFVFSALILLIAETGKPAELEWKDCVAEALAGNSDLARARLAVRTSRARRNSAFGGFLPTLSGSVSAADGADESRLYFKNLDFRYGMSLRASQSIFTGFSTVADYNSACASLRGELSRLKQEEADLRQSLRAAFVRVLYSQVNVRVQEDISGRRKENAKLVQLRYDAGSEDKGTAMRAKADAKQADLDVARASRQLILAQQQLAREMGRDDFAPLTVKDEWPDVAPPEEADIAALAREIPPVVQAEASLESSRADLTGSMSSFWPSVSAGASLYPGWIPDDSRGWGLSVSASYTFFNGGRRWWNYRIARANLERSRESLAAARRDAHVSLQSALFAYNDAYEAMAVSDEYLKASRQRAEIAKVEYTNGLLGFIQWDIIEAELVRAERDFIAARRNLLTAEADWLRILGRGFNQ